MLFEQIVIEYLKCDILKLIINKTLHAYCNLSSEIEVIDSYESEN